MVPMDRLDELRRRHAAAEQGGGAERRARQHKEGKLSARERIELLLDENSFEELDKLVTHRCRDFGMEEQVVPGDGFINFAGILQAAASASDYRGWLVVEAEQDPVKAPPLVHARNGSRT